MTPHNAISNTHPEEATQWHPTKNGDLTPQNTTYGSKTTIWWQCDKGHEWDATPERYLKNCKGCPYCTNRKTLPGFNDLDTTHPNIAAQWHSTKNGDLTPSQVRANKSKPLTWWQCDKGHEWAASITSRTRNGSPCPTCSGRKLLPGFNDLKTLYPELAAEYHPNRNHPTTPNTVNPKDETKHWWLGSCGHEWDATPKNRALYNSNCPYCYGTSPLPGFNDLATLRPDIAAQWHPTKNGDLTPSQVRPNTTSTKTWWRCDRGHEWDATPATRCGGSGCPTCSGHRILPGFNDLETLRPDIATQWHPTKNGDLTPAMFSEHSGEKVWWECDNGHEWKTAISNRTDSKHPRTCKQCQRNNYIKSGVNDLATTHPGLAAQWHPTKNGALTPSQVTSNSTKIVWWQCRKGHEWKAPLYVRTRKNSSGCPVCVNQQIQAGHNDLQTLNPEIAATLHPTLNGSVHPLKHTCRWFQKICVGVSPKPCVGSPSNLSQTWLWLPKMPKQSHLLQTGKRNRRAPPHPRPPSRN